MRIRSVKPEFFHDDQLASLGSLTRLLFVGLWCMADRAGRLEDRPVKIKAQVLPYDECNLNDMLDELHRAEFIQRYEVDGRKYIQIRTFLKHQRPNHREAESTLPNPPREKHNLARERHGRSRVEGKGMEGKGREGNGGTAAPTALAVRDQPWSVEACSDWQEATGGTAAKMGGRIGSALKPLVEKVSREKAVPFDAAWGLVRPWWQKFCAHKNSRFGPEHFAANPRQALDLETKASERGLGAMLEALEAE